MSFMLWNAEPLGRRRSMKSVLRSFSGAILVLATTHHVVWAQSPHAASSAGNETEIVTVDAKPAGVFPRFSPRNPRYVLRPGDVLDISFPYTPDFNQSVPVQPDGFITLREIPDMKISGMNLPELRAAVKNAYS